MKTKDLKNYFEKIYREVKLEKDKLIELDQTFGDGDLGVSMESGFKAINEYFDSEIESDFGRLFLKVSKVFNESAPSSLGTIISFFFMGMAKSLKGLEEASFEDFKGAFKAGEEKIIEKANSKMGQKTILDSLSKAVEAFTTENDAKKALEMAKEKAKEGMEDTKNMVAVHGRASYHKEKTLGHIDGGAYLSFVVFRALAND